MYPSRLHADPTQRVQVLAAEVADEEAPTIGRGQPMTLRIRFVVREPLPVVSVALSCMTSAVSACSTRSGASTAPTFSRSTTHRARWTSRSPCRPSFRRATTSSACGSARATTRSSSRKCSRFRVWPQAEDPADELDRDRVATARALAGSARRHAMNERPEAVPVRGGDSDDRRLEPLRRCLEALSTSEPPPAEILVVDQSHRRRVATLVDEFTGSPCSRRPRPRARRHARATTDSGSRRTRSSSSRTTTAPFLRAGWPRAIGSPRRTRGHRDRPCAPRGRPARSPPRRTTRPRRPELGAPGRVAVRQQHGAARTGARARRASTSALAGGGGRGQRVLLPVAEGRSVAAVRAVARRRAPRLAEPRGPRAPLRALRAARASSTGSICGAATSRCSASVAATSPGGSGSRVRARQGSRVVDGLAPRCLQGHARRARGGLAHARKRR